METNVVKVDAFSPAINPEVTAQLLMKLDIEKYLDQLNQTVALTADERQHLIEILKAPEANGVRQNDQKIRKI